MSAMGSTRNSTRHDRHILRAEWRPDVRGDLHQLVRRWCQLVRCWVIGHSSITDVGGGCDLSSGNSGNYLDPNQQYGHWRYDLTKVDFYIDRSRRMVCNCRPWICNRFGWSCQRSAGACACWCGLLDGRDRRRLGRLGNNCGTVPARRSIGNRPCCGCWNHLGWYNSRIRHSKRRFILGIRATERTAIRSVVKKQRSQLSIQELSDATYPNAICSLQA